MKLEKSFVWGKMRKDLEARYGEVRSSAMWRYAEADYQRMLSEEPGADDNCRAFVFPAVALYRAVDHYAPGEALAVTREYGTKTGLRMRDIFRWVTAVPGVPTLMWMNMDKIAKMMSDGYDCENLVVNEHFCAVDVVRCPLYDKARDLGTPEAAQAICCMDKRYMTGFRGIDYKRTKSVAEGDECCDYRLRDCRKK